MNHKYCGAFNFAKCILITVINVFNIDILTGYIQYIYTIYHTSILKLKEPKVYSFIFYSSLEVLAVLGSVVCKCIR